MLNDSLVLIDEDAEKAFRDSRRYLQSKIYELVLCHALVPCLAVDEPVGPGFSGRSR